MDPHSPRFCARCGNPAPAWYRGDANDSVSCGHCGAEAQASSPTSSEGAEAGSSDPPGETQPRLRARAA